MRSPNIADRPDVYERENAATLADGRLLAAMRRQAPWAGRVLLDLGCGTGFWLPHHAADAAWVIGVEPEPALLEREAHARSGRSPHHNPLVGQARRGADHGSGGLVGCVSR